MRYAWLAIHHCIAHPLMLILPDRWGDALHDWTAARAWSSPPSGASHDERTSEKK